MVVYAMPWAAVLQPMTHHCRAALCCCGIAFANLYALAGGEVLKLVRIKSPIKRITFLVRNITWLVLIEQRCTSAVNCKNEIGMSGKGAGQQSGKNREE